MSIFHWLRELVSPRPKIPALYFNSPDSALEYAGKYLITDISEGNVLPCVVDAVQRSPTVGWIGAIRLPCALGRLEYLAAFMGDESPEPLVGRLCAALIGPQVTLGDKKHTVIVVAELEPTWHESGWKISRRL